MVPIKSVENNNNCNTCQWLNIFHSRHQFPAAAPSNPLVPPSIPAWQLSSSPQVTDGDEGEQGQKGEGDIEVCTSGSGSSENEVVINTGSDSSLEMIRE